jgi:hypothetical protein
VIKIAQRLLCCVILILQYVILARGKYERDRKSQTVAQKGTQSRCYLEKRDGERIVTDWSDPW